jgi:hypothetical protein
MPGFVSDYFWDFGTEVQHELRLGMSVTGGYYRNWYGNFLTTNNLAVTSADYSPFCIAAPIDANLPGGGGYLVCGMYDINPDRFGQVNTLVTHATNYGKMTQVSDFVNVSINVQLRSGMRLAGGVDTGRTVQDACFVVNSLQQLQYCHVVTPFTAQTQVKLNGSYPLPGDFVASGVFQNVPGVQVLSNYSAPTAVIAPSLGRNLAGGTKTATVPLIAPETQFETRRTQLDLRLSKVFRMGSGAPYECQRRRNEREP